MYRGKCINNSNKDQDIGQKKTDLGENFSKEECLAECKKNRFLLVGCEYIKSGEKCTMYTSKMINAGDGDENSFCAIFLGNTFV